MSEISKDDFIKQSKRIDELEREVWLLIQELDLVKAVMKEIGKKLKK